MNAREEILGALRQVDVPDVPKPEVVPSAVPADLVAAFEAGLESVAGRLVRVGQLSEIQDDLDERIARDEQVVCRVDGLRGNREIDDDPRDLGDVDYAVFSADWGVAENGAVWVRDESLGHRITPFITEHLGLVLPADRIVADMHAAMQAIELPQARMGVFIAGPSKTADIEQALVIGAHGACSATVYLV